MLVFDLDPGAPAGILECCEVALVLHGMFDALGVQCIVKTSGSKGLQVYVPLDADTGTRRPSRSHAVGGLLEQRLRELVVSRMSKRRAPGRCWSTGVRTTLTRRR